MVDKRELPNLSGLRDTKPPARLSEASVWRREEFAQQLARVRKETQDLAHHSEIRSVGLGMKIGLPGALDHPVVNIRVADPTMAASSKLGLPTQVSGYEVVVSSMVVRASSCPNMDNTWVSQLQPGTNIGDGTQCATYGMQVWDKVWVGDPTAPLSSQPQYFLTSNHAFPWPGVNIYQPGNKTPLNSSDIVGTVDLSIPPGDPASGGLFEIAKIKSNNSRTFNHAPHAQAYPTEPFLGDHLFVEGAGDMTFGGTVTHRGDGFYVDYAFWVDFVLPGGTTRMYDQMIVMPYYASDTLGADGNSGAVFYDFNSVPVGIQLAKADWTAGGYTYTGAVVSFLNSALADVLAKLNCSNVPPTPASTPPTW